MYLYGDNAIYFDRFGVEHIPKEIKNLVRNKSIITNIYRMQAYKSIMCKYFCIGFIDSRQKGKSLLDYTNLFYSSKCEKNNKKVLKYFQKG